jgi:hypothetical protein
VGGATQPWVTIALAALALIGGVAAAWGGQWIAARTARRREREQHQRDREREETQRKHDTAIHWRDQRLDAYGELLGGLLAWRTELNKAEDKANDLTAAGLANQDQRAPLEELITAAGPVFARIESIYTLLARVELVGSPQVIGRAQFAMTACLAVAYSLKERMGLDLTPAERTGKEGRKYLRGLDEEFRGLREDMRQELGIPDADGDPFPGRQQQDRFKEWPS